ADWYGDKAIGQLTYQAIKYQQRNGWSHRDLLCKTHVRTDEVERAALYRWMVTGELGDGASDRLRAVDELKRVSTAAEAIRLVRAHDLPREVVPTRFLNEVTVWDALLKAGRGMPTTALLRNLAKLSAVGLLTPGSDAEDYVLGRLDGRALRRARVHPLAVLVALTTYQAGRGVRGKLTWAPTRRVIDALDAAFYASFGNVETTGLRWMLALDVSGSMGWGTIAGLPGITPRVASAAMALITAASEPQSWFVGFTSKLTELNISTRQRLDDVVKTMSG
ncbi:MAG: TROVE domain-containing protein, partial [Proteobacteria bacterium]|nr:TROVE domain-containing protein [Pseudomonadota bacterium]